MENVLIIHVDQLRRDVLSCYGGKEVQTPNIDFLAENGVLLENFYTPSAVCTPSRGCFFTGNYPHENGAYRNGIPVKKDAHGFAEAFAKAGYHTGYLGKWHLADHKERGDDLGEYNPLGFEDWDYKVEFGHCKSVAYENGKVRQVEVKVGATNLPYTEISSPEIKEGDKIVVKGLFGLQDNDNVEIKNGVNK